MRTARFLLLSLVLALGACGGSRSATAPEEEAPEYLDDGKSDGTSGLLTTAMVENATSRIFATLTRVPDSSLSSRLVAASRRNVDVELYIVQPTPASAAKVISAQHLEASGVHTVVDREDRCHFAAVVDQQVTTVDADGKIHRSKVKSKVDAAVAAFRAVLQPEITSPPMKIEPDRVRLLRMPDETASEIVGLINGASTSIDLEIYQMEAPPILSALAAAVARNVKVRVMLEPKTVGAVNYTPVSEALKAAGVEVQPTPPAFDTSHKVDHAKFMVIDGTGLLFGTGNLVTSGLGGNPAKEFDTLDYWVEDGRAESVAEATQLFEADWTRQPSTGISFKNMVVTPDNSMERIVGLIDAAQTRLYVYNQSLNDPAVLEHLVSAKVKGVEVRVLLGLQPGYGGEPPANQPAVDQLVQAGIPAALFSRHYLHTKVIVSDDRVFIGSQNFTAGGLRNNREVGEIFTDAAIAEELGQTFLADEQAPLP
ncbi:MAG: hypothetical protein HY898_21940 [Deltaproteobacteria bacterium]|nr:hypothetical protein [Deltaproteobacteria bacterium]